MERLGLLIRNSSSEVRRSDLGTAVVYLALRDPGFAQVASTMKADQEMAKKWGVKYFDAGRKKEAVRDSRARGREGFSCSRVIAAMFEDADELARMELLFQQHM